LRNIDVDDARNECTAIWGAEFATFAGPRQCALIDMAFELGETGLAQFNGMRLAIKAGNWDIAASQALQSLWAHQVPGRAMMDAEMLRSGDEDGVP
jgi:lysozyme